MKKNIKKLAVLGLLTSTLTPSIVELSKTNNNNLLTLSSSKLKNDNFKATNLNDNALFMISAGLIGFSQTFNNLVNLPDSGGTYKGGLDQFYSDQLDNTKTYYTSGVDFKKVWTSLWNETLNYQGTNQSLINSTTRLKDNIDVSSMRLITDVYPTWTNSFKEYPWLNQIYMPTIKTGQTYTIDQFLVDILNVFYAATNDLTTSPLKAAPFLMAEFELSTKVDISIVLKLLPKISSLGSILAMVTGLLTPGYDNIGPYFKYLIPNTEASKVDPNQYTPELATKDYESATSIENFIPTFTYIGSNLKQGTERTPITNIFNNAFGTQEQSFIGSDNAYLPEGQIFSNESLSPAQKIDQIFALILTSGKFQDKTGAEIVGINNSLNINMLQKIYDATSPKIDNPFSNKDYNAVSDNIRNSISAINNANSYNDIYTNILNICNTVTNGYKVVENNINKFVINDIKDQVEKNKVELTVNQFFDLGLFTQDYAAFSSNSSMNEVMTTNDANKMIAAIKNYLPNSLPSDDNKTALYITLISVPTALVIFGVGAFFLFRRTHSKKSKTTKKSNTHINKGEEIIHSNRRQDLS
ncbi:MAG: hypothetical protein ACRAS9_01540 [Mycoplasma sp.]